MLATLFLVNTRGGSHKSDPWERPWITNQGNSNRLNDSVCMHVCSGVCRGRWRVRHVSAFFLFCTLASLLPATSWDGKEPRISPWSHTLLYGSASQCTFTQPGIDIQLFQGPRFRVSSKQFSSSLMLHLFPPARD